MKFFVTVAVFAIVAVATHVSHFFIQKLIDKKKKKNKFEFV